mmetsp:Transcript_1510/g.5159  ORF Transcript_1510/g.5159 Transcript_1510/m.5159 type:complete len:175 (-) Transcript_1510:2588-3112(-)
MHSQNSIPTTPRTVSPCFFSRVRLSFLSIALFSPLRSLDQFSSRDTTVKPLLTVCRASFQRFCVNTTTTTTIDLQRAACQAITKVLPFVLLDWPSQVVQSSAFKAYQILQYESLPFVSAVQNNHRQYATRSFHQRFCHNDSLSKNYHPPLSRHPLATLYHTHLSHEQIRGENHF